MIRKTSQGYKVTSEAGKNLSAPNLSKAQAHKRLAEVEWFKHHPKRTSGQQHSIAESIK